MTIIKKDGKEYVDLATLFSLQNIGVGREDVEKTAWVALGLPLFLWPFTLVVIIFGGIVIAFLGSG